jgi:copper(I)-binding protein
MMAFVVLVSAAASTPIAAQRKDAAISSGWVRLPGPAATETEGYLIINNPTAYDVILQKASADLAGDVEFRAAGKDQVLTFVTVPAYESLEMNPKGTYLLLRNLKKPLAAGDTVQVTVTSDGGVTLSVGAIVKKE